MHKYHLVNIHQLTENQKSRLRNGHPVRVKLGNHHKLHVSEPQLKKLHKSHAAGKAYTLTMDPFQAKQHGAGLFGDIVSKIKQLASKHKHMINPAISGLKKTAHHGISHLSKVAHETIENKLKTFGGEHSGEGIKKRRGRPKKGKGIVGDVLKGLVGFTGLGVKPKTRGRPKKGEGIIGDVLKGLVGVTGLGVKPHKKRGRKGKGVVTDIAKAGAKAAAKVAIKHGAEYLTNKIGNGVKHRRKVGRPRKHKGATLMPAGY